MPDSKALRHNPLTETDEILRDEYYGRPAHSPARVPTPVQEVEPDTDVTPRRRRVRATKKPTHYKVVCISMYLKDIENLERKVAELKRLGYTKANKSQLIRYALNQLDIDNLPVPYDPFETT
jgi:hypothetical protein